MALNYSHKPFFPAAGRGLEGGSKDRFYNHLLSDGGVKDCFDYGRDICKSRGCSQESISKDIIDLLPSDPFGMEISTTFTAITEWLGDLKMDAGVYGRDADAVWRNNNDHQLFAGLNNAVRFQTFPGAFGLDNKSSLVGGMCGFYGAMGTSYSTYDFGFGQMNCHHGHLPLNDARVDSACLWMESACRADGFGSTSGLEVSTSNTGLGSRHMMKREGNASCSAGIQSLGVCDDISIGHRGSNSIEGLQSSSDLKSSVRTCVDEDGMPHVALSFALTSLSVRDLLSVERVCRSLRAYVQNDTLLWKNINIAQPLNDKITDEILLQLTYRAQGHLQCLTLVECLRITDDGLKQVFLNNPRISKLSVPGCTKLTINGIIEILRMCKSLGTLMVKHLRIGGLYGVTPKHFEDLKLLMDISDADPLNIHKPHFFNRGNLYLSSDDNRTIDIEMCPRCEKMRLVYDCPPEVCQRKEYGTDQVCRACTLCIVRCVQCGRCINDGEYEETFCLEVLCSDCSLEHRLKIQHVQVEGESSNSEPQGGMSQSG